MTPAEFGDLTPAEFIPYINMRIKWQEEQTKMENERFGLITAAIQNANRTKKTDPVHHPSEYFATDKSKVQANKTRIGQFFDGMMAWCGMNGGK